MGNYRIIDTDTHLIEPADTWTSRLPKSWGNEVLHVRWDEAQRRELWFFGDEPVKAAWQWAAWGYKPDREFFEGDGPKVQSEAHPGAYDPKARVQLMDEYGTEMHVLYPNLAGFDWAPFVHHPNPELSAAHISAYNDLQTDWVRECPGRFIPMLVVPYWDMPRTLAEIERTADSGFGGIVFTAVPHQHRQPALSSRHWDPMWSACQDAGLSVSFHVSSGDFRNEFKRPEGDEVTGGAAIARVVTATFMENAIAVNDLLMSGILPRFPKLQFASVESGMGWVPFVLDALDSRFIKDGLFKSHPEYGDMLPSDYFRRQVSVNFWFEELTDFHLEHVGLDRLLWETDFPHAKGNDTEGKAEENIETSMGQQPDQIRRAILWDNPARLYANALKQQGVDPLPVSAAALAAAK
jgi:predicted TIM-barrel fold metal-dependent hydrolase